VSGEGTTAQSPIDGRRRRAPGDSTRARILRYLVDSGGPVRVAAIAAHLGLNHNGVRRHLAVLRDAGLVVEERAAAGVPGRPPLEYRVVPAGSAPPPASGAYEELALLLLDLRGNDRSPRVAGAAEGRRAVSGEPSDDSLGRLQAEMARRGFEPELRRSGRAVELVVGRCGIESAAAADPDVVCEIHRGMIEGMLQGTGGKLELRAAFRNDPSRGGCRFRIGPARS
jgi:predicted ArsR family transcriptional regulator